VLGGMEGNGIGAFVVDSAAEMRGRAFKRVGMLNN